MTPYKHQLEVLNVLRINDKGKIILPTGTGKTFIQAWDLAKQIEDNKGFDIYVVCAPLIMLSFQLLVENKKIMYSNGVEARYLCVHSGGTIEDNEDMEIMRIQNNIPYSTITSTTSSSDIKREILSAKKENKPLIIFSTYNSAERILGGLGNNVINTTYCDEAHNLVKEIFNTFAKEVKTKRIFFFTATEKHSESDEGLGMNNEKTYGERLYFMSPRKAIDDGLMLRPRMQIIKTVTNEYKLKEDLNKSFPNIILQSFRQHEFAVGDINPKLLVVVRETADMLRFINSKECSDLIRLGVYVFAISSRDEIGCWVNGKLLKRKDFLDLLKKVGADSTKRMVVLHYKILTEGIDTIFTGVLPFKPLGKLELIQTYGRIGRLYPEDRSRILSGIISPNDLDEMYKSYGWIIIPDILFDNIDDNQRIRDLVYELRDYNFNPIDDIIVSDINSGGIKMIEGIEALNNIKNNVPRAGTLIEEIKSEIEDARIASLTIEEFVSEFF